MLTCRITPSVACPRRLFVLLFGMFFAVSAATMVAPAVYAANTTVTYEQCKVLHNKTDAAVQGDATLKALADKCGTYCQFNIDGGIRLWGCLDPAAAAAAANQPAAGSGAVPTANYPSAPKCSVLPQAICDKAPDGSPNGGIFELLRWVLRIMTVLVGVGAVGGIVWAGILYGSAGDNTAQTKKAKTIITDTVIGIIAYGLMVIFIQWLVPGGVF